MDTEQSRLRSLLNNRYIALGIVVMCAFVVALAVALFNRGTVPGRQATSLTQSSTSTSPQSGSAGTDNQSTSSSEPSSFFEKVTRVFQKSGPASSTQSSAQGSGTTSHTSGSRGTSASGTGGTAPDNADQPYIPELREAQKLPDISIQKYVLTTELPAKPVSPRIYQLKTSYTDKDIANRARSLGFEKIDAVEKGSFIQKVYDLKNSQYLGFDTRSGHFTFYSEPGVPIPNPTASATSTALQVLRNAGLADTYLIASATYQRKDDTTGSTFVEFHRDWKAVGGPIINPLGLLNLTQKDRIDGVTLGWQSPFAIPDALIVNASDGYNEMLRPDSFNTITVKLNLKNRRVYEIASTMPEIISSETLPEVSLITPIEAFTAYTKGQTSIGFTGPSGDGNIILPDVYSNGMAFSKSVDVTDFEVIYPDSSELGMGQWWCPAYALRSFGKVQTGFEVQYAHVVPASRDPRCLTPSTASLAHTLGVSASRTLAQAPIPSVVPTIITGDEDPSSLKYGTIVFKVEAVPGNPSNDCPTDFNHSYILAETSDYVDYVAWIDRSISYQNGSKRRPLASRRIEGPDRTWYYVRKLKAGSQAQLSSLSPSYSEGELLDFRMRAYNASSQGEAGVAPLDPQFANLDTVYCQFIMTGSPWIYAYAPTPTALSIVPQPLGGVAYAQPAQVHGGWDVVTTSSGAVRLADGLTKPALHWEYTAEPIQQALRTYRSLHTDDGTRGYVVPTEQLSSRIDTLARQMGLTDIERSNLLAELNRPSVISKKPYVKITFASDEFLTSALPLYLHPSPTSLHRIYFILEDVDAPASLVPPSIPQVTRTGLTVLETGIIHL